MTWNVTHGTPMSVVTSTFHQKCPSVMTRSGECSLIRLSCPGRISFSSMATPPGVGGLDRGEVLHSQWKAVHGWERVGGHLDCGLMTDAPGEC